MGRRAQIMAIGLALAHIVSPSTSSASLSPGSGSAVIGCQISMTFPVTSHTFSQTNCDGAADGAFVGLGKGNALLATGLWNPLAKKPGGNGTFVNFEIYDFSYVKPLTQFCNVTLGISGDLAFEATASMFINGRGLTGAPGAVVARVFMEQVGGSFVAILSSALENNANYAQNNGPFPAGSGIGVAAGLWTPKPGTPVGTCIAPRTMHFIVTGTVAVEF